MQTVALDVSFIRTQALLFLVCKPLLETRAYVPYLLSHNILAQMRLSTHSTKKMKGFTSNHLWLYICMNRR